MSNNIFFSGIAGSGTSALAFFCAKKGYIVSGSDRLFDKHPNHNLLETFKKNNIKVYPQDGSGVTQKIDTFIYSTAVEQDNPDIIKAISLGISMLTRPEFLAQTVKRYQTIAIAGTSGKSTTSAMLAFLLKELGLKPNFIGGGRAKQFKDETNYGNYLVGDSEILVIEACESDGSIVNYYPHSTILLNLDLDHHKIQDTMVLFDRLIKNTDSLVIYNKDDENLRFINSNGYKNEIKTFSLFGGISDYNAEIISLEGFFSTFSLNGVEFSLSLPGKHNIINAIACISYLAEIGIQTERIKQAIHRFDGIDRRFDIYLDDNRGFVVDDYAHNPHKISFLMETVNMNKENVCYIFQPHGYGPTRLMKDGYIDVFSKYLRNGDVLLVLPIYYAGGSVQTKDISSSDITDAICRRGRSARSIPSRKEIFELIGRYKNFVVFGARDETLSDLALQIKEALCRIQT
ncbi:MAG: Mur ligase family protein [Thermodesulfovibrionales bacterium]|nr:Mur ligase family protein [Thermodesulfovibrionales bacterium]